MTKERFDYFRKLRFSFMEAVLMWEGRLTSARLMERFDVSKSRAHQDFAIYNKSYPNNMEYNNEVAISLRGYRPSHNFRPYHFEGSLESYLDLANFQHDQKLSVDNRKIIQLTPNRCAPSKALQKVFQALYAQKGVRITYKSLVDHEPKERDIWPTYLINTGKRWHIRALRAKDGDYAYRDFILSRFKKCLYVFDNPPKKEVKDAEWKTEVILEFEVNPKITDPEQRRIIQEEFDMTNAVLKVTTNAALAKYLPEAYQIDLHSNIISYEKNLLGIRNYEDVKKYLYMPELKICKNNGSKS